MSSSSDFSPVRFLLRNVWLSGRLASCVALASMLVTAVAAAATVKVSGALVDQVSSQPVGLALLVGVCALVEVTGWVVSENVTVRLTSRLGVRFQALLLKHTLSLPTEFFAERSVGEITDRVSTDVDTVSDATRDQFKALLMAAIGAVTAFVAAVFFDWRLAALMLVFAVVLVFVSRSSTQQVAASSAEVSQAWADAAGTAEEALAARDDLRQALGRGMVMRRWSEHAQVLWGLRRSLVGSRQRLVVRSTGLVRLVQLMVLASGVFLASTGKADVGTVWVAVGLVGLFASRMEDISSGLPRTADASAALGRITDLLSTPAEPPGSEHPSSVDWNASVELRFTGLSFAYDPDVPVLSDVDVTVRPGRALAVVGRTGSGKSTLAKLVNCTLPTPPGTVFVGGVDVTTIAISELRAHVGYITQRVDVLPATIFDNVTLFDRHITSARVDDAFFRLGLSDWLASLPDGVNTRIGPGGQTLSAGEEQLVAFARLLVRDPAVVVLDEATARLDPGTESVLQSATDRMLAGRTAVLVAHRLATIASADDVVVLDEGRVVEHGVLQVLANDPDSVFGRLVESSGGLAVSSVDEPHEHRLTPKVTPPESSSRSLSPHDGSSTDSSSESMHVPSLTRMVLSLLNRHRRYAWPALAAWTVFFASSSVTAAVWSRLPGALGSPSSWWLVVIWAVGAAAGLAGRAFGENFSSWWVLSNITVRANLLAAQLHPHDDKAGAPASTPGEGVSRIWDSDKLLRFSDMWVDMFGTLVFVVSAVVLTGDLSMLVWLPLPAVAALLVSVLLRRRLQSSALDHVAKRGQWAGLVAGVCASAATVKGFAAESDVVTHLESESHVVAAALVKRMWVRSAVVALTPNLTVGFTRFAVLLGLALSAQTSGVGPALATFEALGVMTYSGYIVASIVSEAPAVRSVLARMYRMLPETPGFDLTSPPADLSLPPAPLVSVPTPRPSRTPLNCLRVQDVSVVFPDGTVAVSDVCFQVFPGQLVVVTGPVASGKTTLLRVLAGLQPASEGSLFWNDVPVDDPTTLLRPPNVTFLGQVPRIVSGSVVDNVGLDHGLDVGHAVGLAELHPDLAAVGGLNARVGHRGLRLSGGQVQRLAAARAAAPKAELLVLDDLSSALDVVTEKQLWSNFRQQKATVVATSYKRAALELADVVVVLRQGRVVATGSLAELEDEFGHMFV